MPDEQWASIAPRVTYQSDDDRYKGGRVHTVILRRIVDALLYQARTGCHGCLLLTGFANHSMVRYYFDKWTWNGTRVRGKILITALWQQVRLEAKRDPELSAGSMDSQSVETMGAGGERAFEGRKYSWSQATERPSGKSVGAYFHV